MKKLLPRSTEPFRWIGMVIFIINSICSTRSKARRRWHNKPLPSQNASVPQNCRLSSAGSSERLTFRSLLRQRKSDSTRLQAGTDPTLFKQSCCGGVGAPAQGDTVINTVGADCLCGACAQCPVPHYPLLSALS